MPAIETATCQRCQGSGEVYDSPHPSDPDVELEKCLVCDGRGYVPNEQWNPETCEDCGGEGQITRNYLQEALRIVRSEHCMIEPTRKHLVALVRHFSETIPANRETMPATPETTPRKPVQKEAA